MIELGRYQTEFIVNKNDLDTPTDYNAKNYRNGHLLRLVYDRCSYKGFGCWIIKEYDYTVKLKLITFSDEEDIFIPIVI